METVLQDSLSHRISKKIDLTTAEQASLVALLGSGCRQKTKGKLASVARWVPDIKNYGIYERVVFEKGGCGYIAGQSYPDEIRTVRELLLGL